MTLARSACPYDCPDCCGLLVEVEAGRAVAVKGDPEHPYSRGTLCPKMNDYQRQVHSPQRLTTPLERVGAKGEGAFRPISWEAAVARIAERLREVAARHGAEAILPYSYAGTMGLVQRNAGHAFFHRLGASRLDRTICASGKEAGWKSVMGATLGLDPDEAAKSDLIVMWGLNAVATNLHFVQRVKQARARGARVWAIDTYETPTAALADEQVLVRPGSDGALALGLMHVLDRDGLTDRAFVEAHVQGHEALRAEVLPRFPPARVAEVTGLAPERIEALARAFAAARAPFIRLGNGLSRYGNGAMNVRCILGLSALAGSFGRDGGGCYAGSSGSEAFDVSVVTRPDLMPSPAPRIVNMNRLGEALAPSFPNPVKALFVYHSNPAAVAPDQNAVLAGLAREDLFTVVHERFLTDTARYADLVLPATSSLEHPDLYRSYGHYAVQRARPAIPPVGESKPNWELFQLLARAMGFEDEVFRRSADDLIDALLARPSPMREGLDRAALEAGRAVPLRLPADARRFRTPSGKMELLNPREARPLLDHLPTHEDGGALPLRLQTGVNPYTLNSTFMDREDLRAKAGGMRLQLSPAEARARGLSEGDAVVAWNGLGEVRFTLHVSAKIPDGLAVAEGVWWIAHAPGDRTVNALTSQRLSDQGGGSTFYDNRVDVRRAEAAPS
ncbi:molybdopterin oxidoreductase family protein [Anaeromyxobacter paludicola]|uniref:Formate dehydrogenase n=1 Tax=Anaeromyxobacter paludicola TaxID=2918171 RepID=A0ABN6N542_9BACT|nr:molybdopterin oxidoreductase family protein [Anaeromyxobacter paludicola]BDG06973.1 formate dehydrogenase [Anaeromyxobacter paludicola]